MTALLRVTLLPPTPTLGFTHLPLYALHAVFGGTKPAAADATGTAIYFPKSPAGQLVSVAVDPALTLGKGLTLKGK